MVTLDQWVLGVCLVGSSASGRLLELALEANSFSWLLFVSWHFTIIIIIIIRGILFIMWVYLEHNKVLRIVDLFNGLLSVT